MLIRLTCLAMLALLLAIPSYPAGAQGTGAATEEDPVVARVGGAEVRLSEVVEARQALPEQYRASPLPMIFPQIIEKLIDVKLVSIEGRKANLQDDQAVRQRMARIEDQLIYQVYLNRYLEGIVTEAALRQRYQAFVEAYPPRDEIKARHILVGTEEEARTVIERIAGGAAFEDVAKDVSTDGTALRGGDLGYFVRGAMVAEFSEAAFKLKAGEMTEVPVQTQFGWHVIRVDDRRLAAPPPFEQARAQLGNEIARQAIAELTKSLRERVTIERFNMDGTPMTEAPSGAQ